MPERQTTPPVLRHVITVDLIHEAGDWPPPETVELWVEQAATAVAGVDGLIDANRLLCVALSDDASVAVLNSQFRGKATATNVLSFPPGPDPSPSQTPDPDQIADGVVLGDIVLALETVALEAREQGIPLADHVRHLVVHGMLHLLGFDHEQPVDAELMERQEIDILAGLGIANPYTGALQSDDKEKTGQVSRMTDHD